MLRQILSLPRSISLVVIAGLAIRLILAPFTSHPFDMGIFYAITQQINRGEMPFWGLGGIPMFYYTLVPVSFVYGGLAGPFSAHPIVTSILPPIVQSALGWVLPGNGPAIVVPDILYNLLEKIPLIVSDLLVGLILYKIVNERYGSRPAFVSFSLWFLNPMVIWVSGAWGMFDSLPALFSILATYFVLKRRYSLGAYCLAIGVGYKLYPLLLLVPLLVFALRSEGNSYKKLIRPLIVFAVSLLILFLPIVPQLAQSTSVLTGSQSGNPSTNPASTFGLTYWSAAPFTPISASGVAELSTFLLILFVILATIFTILKLRTIEDLFFWELVLIATLFFSYPRVNEQWFLWLLPFLVVISQTKPSKKYLPVLSFVGLFYSWINSQFTAFFVTDYALVPNQIITLAKWTVPLSGMRLPLMGILGVLFSLVLILFLYYSKPSSRVTIKLDQRLEPVRNS